MRSELVRRSRDPGVWLNVREVAGEIGIQRGDPDGGWMVFQLTPEDLEEWAPRNLAYEMLDAALEQGAD